MRCCTEECYQKSCTEKKTMIFLIAVFIVIIALLGFSIYLVAKPVECIHGYINRLRSATITQYPKEPPTCVETPISLHPQVVAIVEDSGAHVCSGTIVSQQWIVTAGHCLLFCKENCSNFRVRGGCSRTNRGGTLYGIARFELHPDFNGATLQNNIGLVKVNGRLNAVAKISAAPVEQGQRGELLGWSPFNKVNLLYTDNVLKKVDVTAGSSVICRYRMKGGCVKLKLTNYMVCGTYPSGGGDCYVDAGGPLMRGDVLTAVAMFGQICYSCEYHISILTDIFYFKSFLQNYTTNTKELYG